MKIPEFPRDESGLIQENNIDYRKISSREKIYLEEELKEQHNMLDEIQGFNIYDFLKNYVISQELINEIKNIEIKDFVDEFTYEIAKERLTTESVFKGCIAKISEIFGEEIVKQSVMYTKENKLDYSKTLKCIIENLYTDLLDWLKIEFYNEFTKPKYTNGNAVFDYYTNNLLYDGIEELIKRNFIDKIEEYPYFKVRNKIMDHLGENITKDTSLDEGIKFVNACMYLAFNISSITMSYNKNRDVIVKVFEDISSAYVKQLVYENFAKDNINDENKKQEILEKMKVKVEDTSNLMYYNISYKDE